MVTVAKACAQLGISKDKIYELMSSGEIAYIALPATSDASRPGRNVTGQRGSRRIEQSEIDAFIERHRVSA